VSVTKRIYEYTGKDGKTKTYTVWRARVWTYPPHGPRRQIEEEFDGKTAAEKWEQATRHRAWPKRRLRAAHSRGVGAAGSG
jgi:hypothetical protein